MIAMAGRKKTFSCGHSGQGRHCHRCEQEERERAQRQANRRLAEDQLLGVPNLHEALALARKRGCEVSTVRRTGEVLVNHKTHGRVRINNRRKDTPRALITLLARLDTNQRP